MKSSLLTLQHTQRTRQRLSLPNCESFRTEESAHDGSKNILHTDGGDEYCESTAGPRLMSLAESAYSDTRICNTPIPD